MEEKVTIFTDGASICAFDPDRLKHRLDDAAGWWVYPPTELLKELNCGNLMVVNIGSDGVYDLRIHQGPVAYPQWSVTAKLACSSGQVFIGKGEAVVGDGFGPTDDDGLFVALPPGTYEITVAQGEPYASEFEIGWTRTEGAAENAFQEELQLLPENRQYSLDDIRKIIARVQLVVEDTRQQPIASSRLGWAVEKLRQLDYEFAQGEPGAERRKWHVNEIDHTVKQDRAFRDSELGQGLLLIAITVWRPWAQDYPERAPQEPAP